MAENRQLTNAKSAKNDEFHTQYADIQKEVNAYLDFNPDTFRGKTMTSAETQHFDISPNFR